MKIALCFSGKLGEWRECEESILQNIIHPLKPDIFLSTWDEEDYEEFVRFYRPKKWQAINFQDTMSLLQIEKLDHKPNPGLVPMLAGMKAVNSIYNEYKLRKRTTYDLIIRMRPDIKVLEQIKRHEIEDCIKNKYIRLPFFESNNIYNHEIEMQKEIIFNFVYDKASLPNQINDQIAIGHPDQMDRYMNSLFTVGEAIRILWEEGYPEYMIKVPESVITLCLNIQNCKYKQLTGSNPFNNINTLLVKNGKTWYNKGHTSIEIK